MRICTTAQQAGSRSHKAQPRAAPELPKVTAAVRLPAAVGGEQPSSSSAEVSTLSHTTKPRSSHVCQTNRRPAVFLFGMGGGQEEYYDEAYTVMKVQVGVFGDVSKWQRNLERLGDLYDTDDEDGLHSILQETLQLLMRNTEYCSYFNSGGRAFEDPDQAESKFNEVSFEERAKFKEETLTNVEGRMQQRRSSTRQDPDQKDLDQWICITLILAVERDLKLPKVRTVFDLKQAIKTLAGVTVDELLAFELLWTPQDEGDSYSKDELLADYPTMVSLT